MRSGASALRVVVVHPDLIGTYGDGGNGVVLAQRARWRGFDAELVQATSDRPVPSGGDLYCMGGGEDGPQSASASRLAREGSLSRARDAGAGLLAVCAGFQIVGAAFVAGGRRREGLGLLDVETVRSPGPRAVGEMVAEGAGELGIGALTGYENHAGITRLGRDARPLGRVVAGIGNGFDGIEGAWAGRVVATYLHGPVLARNPALADLVLSFALGPLAALDDLEVEELRAERLRACPRPGASRLRRLVATGRGLARLKPSSRRAP